MVRNSRRLCLYLFSWVLVVVIVGGGGTPWAQANAEVGKTYIEFIFDASYSMTEEAENGKTRMDVAKEVMTELVRNLEARPGLEVGLRLYGSRQPDCDDTFLAEKFGPVDEVRDRILTVIKSLRPRGKTPIAYSLEKAAKDFPSTESRNVIVLITDGEESCGGDPCSVSHNLQSQGIILEPYVVGFGLSREAEAKVRCIGKYYSAKDRKSLSEALEAILGEVVDPPALEVEAWGNGVNVTAQAAIEVSDASGEPVRITGSTGGNLLRTVLEAGTYTVRGQLEIAPGIARTATTKAQLVDGETTRVRLDFGNFLSTLQVEVYYRGEVVTPKTELAICRNGEKEATYGTGHQLFRHEALEGEVELEVSYPKSLGIKKRVKGVALAGGETKRVVVHLDDVMGTVRARVLAGEEDVTSQATVLVENWESQGRAFLEGEYQVLHVPPELYGVKAERGSVASGLVEATVKAGEIIDILLKLNVPGRIVLHPTVDGAPISLSSIQALARWGEEAFPFREVRGQLVAEVPTGAYDIEATYLSSPQQVLQVNDVNVEAGATREVTLDYAQPGHLSVTVTVNDQACSDVQLELWQEDRVVGVLKEADRGSGVFAAGVLEGTYDIQVTPHIDGFREQWLRQVQIRAGQRIEKEVKLGVGTLVVRPTMDARLHTGAQVLLYREGFDAITALYDKDTDAFVVDVKEGIYDIQVNAMRSGYESVWLRSVEVVAGETVEKKADLGGNGTLVLRVLLDGRPHGKAQVLLRREGVDAVFVRYDKSVEAFVIDTKQGSYDIRVQAMRPGYEDVVLRGVELIAGETLKRTVDLGGAATLIVKVTLDGKPHEKAQVYLFRKGIDSVYARYNNQAGGFMAETKEGTYDIMVQPMVSGYEDIWVRGVELVAGETVETTVEVAK